MATLASAPAVGVPLMPGDVGAKWTNFPCRVRPDSIDSSRRLTPSTRQLLGPPDPGLVAGQRRAVDHGLQPLEALGDHLGRDELVLHGGGPCPRPGREDERVRAVVGGVGHHGQRVFEVLLGLAGKAHDDVGRHAEVVDGRRAAASRSR